MRRLLLLFAAVAAIACNKDSIYESTEMTVYDAVEAWKLDAEKIGGFTSEEIDDMIGGLTVEFEEGEEGYLGWAWPSSKVIRINSIYWKGSAINQNTVYHEIGHVLGLPHDVTPVMSAYGGASTALKGLKEYFELIKTENYGDIQGKSAGQGSSKDRVSPTSCEGHVH